MKLAYLYSLSSLAISQLLLMALLYLLFFMRNRDALVPFLLCVCLIGMVVRLVTLVDGSEYFWLKYSSQRLTQAVPALIWILAFKLFSDKPKIPLNAIKLVILYQVLLALLPFVSETGDSIYYLVNRPAYLLMFAISAHSVIMVLEGRASDLISKRRRLRISFAIFAIGIGLINVLLYAFSIVVSVLGPLSEGSPGRLMYLLCIALIFIFAMIANLSIVSLFSTFYDFNQMISWTHRAETSAKPVQKRGYARTVNRITELMETDKLYRDPELTISKLALLISSKEHRLRTVINQEMGYRNFNQFLNNYRIKEACQLLKDEEALDQSISNISLEVGYASLSSFNKAFKEITGVTPSSFRGDAHLFDGHSGDAFSLAPVQTRRC